MQYFSYSVQWKLFRLVVAENRQLAAVKTLSKKSFISSFNVVARKFFSDSDGQYRKDQVTVFTVKYVLYDYFSSLEDHICI
jgi:hypothetical protein